MMEGVRLEKKQNAYPPHSSAEENRLPIVRERYSYLQPEEKAGDLIELCGRVTSKRFAGKKLFFLTIQQENALIQLRWAANEFENMEVFKKANVIIKRGDIIAVKGFPFRTKNGELSLNPMEWELLAPCLHMLPLYNEILDGERRARMRYRDLMLNSGVKDVFIVRSKIMSSLRKFFETRGFVEVETPILDFAPSGAIAKPFKTFHNSLKSDLYMRIAPELYLKQIIIGGIERVFEIGKSFRNEGLDATHNVEFTTLEFYQAYADYYDILDTTEQLFRDVIFAVTGGYTLEYDVKGETVILDFSKPFKRISIIEELEKILDLKLPNANEETEENVQFLKNIYEQYNIELPQAVSTSKLFEGLIEEFLEVSCLQPTFLMDYPTITSPLAKPHRTKENVVERFELFIAHMELCNAYTELNDPVDQAARFEVQSDTPLEKNVKEIQDNYVLALEHGLPPTGGFGLGIDRLCMLITNSKSIKDVLLFPLYKPDFNN